MTQHEVRCLQCDVSFPVGTKRCLHCGGRVGARKEPPPARGRILFDVEEAEEADESPVPRPIIRKTVASIWLLLALAASLYRVCAS